MENGNFVSGFEQTQTADVTKPRFVNRRSLMSPQGVELSLPKDVIARFPPMHRYLIGVSGGRDSIALLHLLTNLGYRRLIVCHLDHQLRGRSSTADAKFVRGLARKLKLECELGRINVAVRARRKKQSIETAGRNARYEFFARIARRRRCRTIFLGHHADDLVETFLLNLFRGAGPTGLACGIELQNRGVKTVLIEKGCVVNSIYHYPTNMVFFTTPELLEIGNIPMTSLNEKPVRTEANDIDTSLRRTGKPCRNRDLRTDEEKARWQHIRAQLALKRRQQRLAARGEESADPTAHRNVIRLKT